ncbi:DUF502 domain-containing protein [Halostella salina]|uniref:DUF502 domain-containing protein n=1 Tax=Halostella salina TaxID=1547897 RepID=UPI000EF79451|nr:DUF502 domain-containing protein [Halostella salina]
MSGSKVGDDGRGWLRRAFVTGTAITVPTIITLILLGAVLDFVSNTISPAVAALGLVPGTDSLPEPALELLTVGVLLTVVFVVGFVAERSGGGPSNDSTGGYTREFDEFVAAIPGVGTVYSSVRKMSDVLLESDTESFQEVKLVEFPHDETYMLCFLTSHPPDAIRETVGESEMETLFLPLAPNPVMGGFLINVPTERVHDVDLTVEEGVRAIVTSGVATGEEVDDISPDGFDDISPTQFGEAIVDKVAGAGPGDDDAKK